MFTGIVETLGKITDLRNEGNNVHLTVQSAISGELKVDQSLAHNGVCLTVTARTDRDHTVTAVSETMRRSNLGNLRVGDVVNLERAMLAGGRLDGHIVQGHVDTTGVCTEVRDEHGSWHYTFRYEPSPEHLLVDKGSICINGVSLTVVDPHDDLFSVAIIPYTYEHTTFRELRPGDTVNLEFDILGKYLGKYLAVYGNRMSVGTK